MTDSEISIPILKKEKGTQEELTKRLDHEREQPKQKENFGFLNPVSKERNHQTIGSRTLDDPSDRNPLEVKPKGDMLSLETTANHRILRQIAKNQPFEAFPSVPGQARDRSAFDTKVRIYIDRDIKIL